MRHRVRELVGKGRGHIGTGAIGADPDRRGVMAVIAVAGGADVQSAFRDGEREGLGMGAHRSPQRPARGVIARGRVTLGRLPGCGGPGQLVDG